MSTTRTVAATRHGAAHLYADLSAYDLTVITEARVYAEVTVSTRDDSGPSAEAVNAFTLDATASELHVTAPRGGGMTMQVNHGGGVFISGDSYSNVVVGNGTVMVNGRVVSGGRIGGSPISVVARMPHGSSVRASSRSGDIRCDGVFDAIDAASQSGDVRIGTVRQVSARTQSGDVDVDALTGGGDLSSMSGDIEVRGPVGASCSARTMSGDVRYSGGIRVAGSSMSGRVLNR